MRTRPNRLVLSAFVLSAVLAAVSTTSPIDAIAATEIPEPPSAFVTDRAAFLSADVVATLSQRLANYQRASGHQVLVYIDHTTAGVPIEDWAVRAFQSWRVGRRGFDDGAILFLFADDRRVRIEVGYGLEGRVPDALAGRIINDQITPRLKAGDRDGAVRAGVDGLLAAIGDGAAGGAATSSDPQRAPVPVWVLIIGGVLLLLLLGGLASHPALAAWLLINIASGRGGGGGGWGGGGGGGGFSGGGGRSGGGGASGSW